MRNVYTHVGDVDLEMIEPIRNRNFVKPYGGLWLSVNDDWEQWCEYEEPDWLKEKPRHRITLSESAKVLRVISEEDLERLPRFEQSTSRNLPPLQAAGQAMQKGGSP